MRCAVVVAVLLGCGGTPPPAGPTKSAREILDETREAAVAELIALVESRNAPALAAMFEEPLAYGGLWFPDTDCRRQFAATGHVYGEAARIFANCLASLPLVKSARVHPYADVAVLTYEPGIELDVFFARSASGDIVIRFIGYTGRRGPKDALPMVTQAALEALRVDPQPVTLDEATTAAIAAELATHKARDDGKPFSSRSWFKVCLDAGGAVTSIRPRSTTTVTAQEGYAKALGAWTFKPFMLGGQPSPVCSLVRLGDPVTPGSVVPLPTLVPVDYDSEVMIHVPAFGDLVEGELQIVPEDRDKNRIKDSGIRRLEPTIAFCVTETGQVDTVRVARPSGFPSYDRTLVVGVSKWRYRGAQVAGRPVRACGTVNFVYTQIVR
jgi:TonB family protein